MTTIKKVERRIRDYLKKHDVKLEPQSTVSCAVGVLAATVDKTFDEALTHGISSLNLKSEQVLNLEAGFEARGIKMRAVDGGEYLWSHQFKMNCSPYYALGFKLREEALGGQAFRCSIPARCRGAVDRR